MVMSVAVREGPGEAVSDIFAGSSITRTSGAGSSVGAGVGVGVACPVFARTIPTAPQMTSAIMSVPRPMIGSHFCFLRRWKGDARGSAVGSRISTSGIRLVCGRDNLQDEAPNGDTQA